MNRIFKNASFEIPSHLNAISKKRYFRMVPSTNTTVGSKSSLYTPSASFSIVDNCLSSTSSISCKCGNCVNHMQRFFSSTCKTFDRDEKKQEQKAEKDPNLEKGDNLVNELLSGDTSKLKKAATELKVEGEEKTKEALDKAREKKEDLQKMVTEKTEEAQKKVTEMKNEAQNKVTEKKDELQKKVTEMKDDAKEKIENLIDHAKEATIGSSSSSSTEPTSGSNGQQNSQSPESTKVPHETKQTISEKAQEISSKAAHVIQNQSENIKEKLSEATTKFADTSESVREKLNKEDIGKKIDAVKSNQFSVPMAIIAIGIVAGIVEYYRSSAAKQKNDQL